MAMGYIDSTPPQVARVIGGWCLGCGIFLFVMTFPELGSAHPSGGAILAIVLTVVGGLLLGVGSRRLGSADRSNRRYFAENAGTEILARRRRLQIRLTALRWAFCLALVSAAAFWVVLAGTYSCIDEICSGFMSNQGSWIDALRWVCVGLGAVTLVVATLARVHGSETDRWEELASDYLRRRDDGPVPGLKTSRWE
jgi:amino acid transporter